ncbi:MAG TPA: hypothetical protein VF703_17745 [Pyrinomonadaceae bacterium]|jgi:hypothetical protein
MSSEQPHEEPKSQPQETESVSERLVRDFRTGSAEDRSIVFAVEPQGTLGERSSHIYIDKQGKVHITLGAVLDSKQQISEEEEAERSVNELLAQIDLSRERAQAAQTEIDQLRTETRQLIAHLFAA